ncbi:MAG: hypothetical protein AABZ31_05295 [Bdellovibrionota bacterium]
MPPKYTAGQKVDLRILRETPLGYVAEINGEDEGLLYFNEVFERLDKHQEVPGYIARIRPDNSIDLILQPLGHQGMEELGERVLVALQENEGFLPLNDKAQAEDIYDTFGVSKKKYKMAIGGLYKKRLIRITPEGIHLEKSATEVPKKT